MPRRPSMARPLQHSSRRPPSPPPRKSSGPLPRITLLLLVGAAAPLLLSALLYRLHDFDPAAISEEDYPLEASVAVPLRVGRILPASELLGDGLLPGPEDLAYDGEEGILYTGCSDGWIRRVRLITEGAGEVEDWAYVGGRPLGLALGRDGSLVVAEATKGLVLVKADKSSSLLTDQAEGLKFGLIDGVDVAKDGAVFFTDASYKYGLGDDILDVLEGRPHGRLLRYDPSTNETAVLLRDLYIANGLSISPDQRSLIFCETLVRRCRRYHIRGEKAGTVKKFIENLPGLPDNIRYDGENSYWIALAGERTLALDILVKYPSLRKLVAILAKFVELPPAKNSGVLKVSLDGQPMALYSDPELSLVTGGIRIGEYLYYGNLIKPYIGRINLTFHGAI